MADNHNPILVDEKFDDQNIKVDAVRDDQTTGPTWDAAAEKRLVRKMDIRIFPIMIILFILNFIGTCSPNSCSVLVRLRNQATSADFSRYQIATTSPMRVSRVWKPISTSAM
jgi:hypothetical protein